MSKKIYVIVSEFFYLFLIFFFCYTSVNKLMNLNSFRTNLIKTSLFTDAEASWFSILVILIEIFVILVLIFKKRLGLMLITLLLLIFTLYISYLRFKGLYEVCGCGGILNGLDYKYHLIINITLIFSGLYSLIVIHIFNDEK